MTEALELVVLGSGGGLPTRGRDTSGYLVRCGGDLTLVDCPGGVVHKLLRHGVPLERLTRLVLTHDHVDHIYGLPHLVHAMAIRGDRQGPQVFGPQQTLARVAEVLRAHELDRAGYPVLQLQAIPLAVATVFEAAGMRLRAAPARHGRDTVSLRFDSEAASLAISSDTLPSDELVGLAGSVDLLLHDCGGLHSRRETGFGAHHASAREAGQLARNAGVAALLLTHLPTDDPAVLTALRQEAAAAFGGPVDLAEDGREYRIGSAAARTSLR